MAAGNPDQALLHALVRAPLVRVPVDTNPVALDLSTQLQAWDRDAGVLQLGFTTAERHVQGNNAVHGGVVTTMLDFGLAFVVLAQLEPPRVAVTAALNVHFERGVQPGPVVVRARADRLGTRLAFASAELQDATGRVLARATATLAIV
ncbi:MAG TPA: PaaI family thioesterase [Ramlibacter sp.]|nr:PaaI family thioesterase [Ramlibacter sp.]